MLTTETQKDGQQTLKHFFLKTSVEARCGKNTDLSKHCVPRWGKKTDLTIQL